MSSNQRSLPLKNEDFSGWYNTLVKKAGLVSDSPVRGCMILKPYGFALWERIQKVLDQAFKRTGHQNAYFPLFIPLSYLSREADHVEGFAKECAVVTHYRLKGTEKGEVLPDPDAALEEPLVVRPTSETVIWNAYSKWVHSYRDLPLLLNQWANVVRWEMRTRPFLRTAEILWQEGHTAHATAEEAEKEARQMHDLYADFLHSYLAIPAIQGEKTAHERFAGALNTYTLEALMQDGKALQLATSHFLGQNFSKAFNVRFTNEKGDLQYAWGTSWGLTTRLIGALIMTHGDDQGLLLPPNIAPIQVVILPIVPARTTQQEAVWAKAEEIHAALQAQGIRSKIDRDESHTPGWKFAEYELQGVPIRLVIGPRDLETHRVELVRRDTREKRMASQDALPPLIEKLLSEIQEGMLQRAQSFQQAHTREVARYEDFKQSLQQEVPGFLSAHWDGTTETEKAIQQETQATIRCIVSKRLEENGHCIYSGKPSKGRVLFAKAY